jgi:metal-responsive CopG/Arc/MetJ family transcriptional regulator
VNAKRINITIPERILDAIDRFSQKRGQTRSGFLVEAATEHIGRAGGRSPSGRAKPSAKARQTNGN